MCHFFDAKNIGCRLLPSLVSKSTFLSKNNFTISTDLSIKYLNKYMSHNCITIKHIVSE